MSRRIALVLVMLAGALVPVGAAQAAPPDFAPGAPGAGDPYFPEDGNGGYDIRRYLLDLDYDPATDVLRGTATVRARATQDLSSFNLDLHGLSVRSITVDGRRARWSRAGDELTVTPRRGLREGVRFTTVVRYDGVPDTIEEDGGRSGFLHTDDGALVAGQPDAAATWFPVNDHPIDPARYRFRVTVPAGLEVIANGVLRRTTTRGGLATWVWEAEEPLASYLTALAIGEFDVRAYSADGIRFWDALDPDLFTPPAPRTGERFAIAGVADSGYKRLARTISVPAEGAQLSFWVRRDTEANWDHLFVEARPAGSDAWTTLPDVNGHTTQETGSSCPGWHALHPFLTRYQTGAGDGTCTPSGTTGAWWAASGASDGYEQWTVDLAPYAGTDVEVAIAYATDDIWSLSGVFVDDVTVTGAAGSTSFEDDGDTFDGWTVTGPPEGSPPTVNDWIAGTSGDTPPTLGERAEASLARQPEIIEFLSGIFGPYPFTAGGGIVDDVDDLGFALETQTRPVYAKDFFNFQESGDAVVVHELAHQWTGDLLRLERWQHIWLNEGFASYAEWLWAEREGIATADETFAARSAIPADSPFWAVAIGDPGTEDLFDIAVYERGAMTLHALRREMGDEPFFRLLREWIASQAGGTVRTDEFVALAEEISGRSLDDFFETWLFTAARPPAGEELARVAAHGHPFPALQRLAAGRRGG